VIPLPNNVIILFAALIAAVLSGCARLEAHEMDTRLNDSVRAYSKAIRWGNFRLAARHVRHRDGSQPVIPVYSGELRVIGVNADPGKITGEPEDTPVPLRVEYVDPRTSRVDVFETTQIWWYDPTVLRWFVDDDVPHLGKPQTDKI
jgi:hypothetical protein